MATNYPGPYELRVNYVVATRPHQARFNLRISGTPAPGEVEFSEVDVLLRDDTTLSLDTVTETYVSLAKVFMSSADADFVTAELWDYEPESFDASFVAAYEIAEAGTSGNATVPASQFMFTFRTQEGGVMKVNLMDAAVSPGQPITPPYTGSTLAFASMFTDPDAPFLARDTSYPIANIRAYPGQNEALFKKIYRV